MTALQLTESAWGFIESGDMDSLAALFAVDAELTTSAGGGQGRQYVTELFTRHREGYPDITHQILDSIESADGDAVALRLEFKATHLGALRGPFGVIEPTGLALVWRSADQVRSKNGQIISWHAQFDRLTVLQQLGQTKTNGKSPLVASSPSKEVSVTVPSTLSDNKATLRAIFGEVFEQGNLAAFDDYVTPDFINHRTPPGIANTADGVKSIVAIERAGFPDITFTVDHEAEEGDLVIQVATAEATHLGTIFGVEATGKRVRWQQVHIARMRDGRMAEHWGVSDLAGLWMQIGRIPPPPAKTPNPTGPQHG